VVRRERRERLILPVTPLDSNAARTRLAVLGSPISHSRSPAIHRAAYTVLGLDWSYESEDVTGDSLAHYIGSRDPSWRGLSLTMPLKRDILPLLDSRDPLVETVGGANTVLFGDDGLRGFNTDVQGTIAALAQHGITRIERVHILGGGATAASVIVALQRLGLRHALVSVRSPERSTDLRHLGRAIGVTVEVGGFATRSDGADLLVNTIPGRAEVDFDDAPLLAARVPFFEVAYDPWPSPRAARWDAAGLALISGLDLLIHQAVGQVRIFLTGDQHEPLPSEPAVVEAMRVAVA
jgi:shikimate dehydrogenase